MKSDSSEVIEDHPSNQKPVETSQNRASLKDLSQSIAISTQGNEISGFFGPEDNNLLEMEIPDEPVEIKEGLKLLIKNFENPAKVLRGVKIERFEKCSDTILEEFTKIHFVMLKLQRHKDLVLQNIKQIIQNDESLVFQQQYLEILMQEKL